ncbi:hypothetical protein A3C89_03135 [Candidatus Kaiserbacteria bacterium RIFCSPHIGHO2_02_FULL_50_50]|uniref:Uncharacterized protein n=1 Tax=Candidatus Kaiserbacteria bacterium RIFCSPHIGHO2_02_FULL_50_50 TaxID=1798492 RepID=A0A1F6DF11_9BACT|nr:MAG: hypothetical protein A3C89_03135 [Candidatus Kaiserbacteria bacterium RIFCSPHIGHO2_02_FULL_50_50]OGG89091.1 MAG: hypothetical protein A3G62_02165 [Candidatus Kaiserbacteria bacterium RIFCSPLOWO2_12_FULL_50_10]
MELSKFLNEVSYTAVAHEYPFLILGQVFDACHDKRTRSQEISQAMELFIRKYVERKSFDSETFKRKVLKDGFINNFFGTESVSSLIDPLANFQQVETHMYLTNTIMKMMRYGNHVAFRMTDSSGAVHHEANEALKHIADGEYVIGQFREFVRVHCVEVHHTKRIDMQDELASADRFLAHMFTACPASNVAEALVSDYKERYHDEQWGDVQVGLCCNVPVYARLVFGDNKHERVWRHGAVTCKDAKIIFSDMASGTPSIQYFVKSSAEMNPLLQRKPDETYFSFSLEWSLHKDIAAMLFNGLSARSVYQTYQNNQHLLPNDPE